MSKLLTKEARKIKTTCELIGEGQYGEVFLNSLTKRVYKIGDISRREFNILLKLSKEGMAPVPYTIKGKSNQYILEMEYIDGWLVDDLINLYWCDETIDTVWDKKVLLELINFFHKFHYELKMAHNDLHGANVIYNGSFKLLDVACVSKDPIDIYDEISELHFLCLPDYVMRYILGNISTFSPYLPKKEFFKKVNNFYVKLKEFIINEG